jgi:mannose-6-phosphate isomerase-like protein (cupin superfamily)
MQEQLIEVNVTPKQIKEHLLLPYSSFIKDAVRVEEVGNSVVFCSQWFPIFEIAKACYPKVPLEDIKIGINYVHIEGELPEGEEMHVHISFLVGICVEGQGVLIYEKDGKTLEAFVEQGDMIFVPRNTLHYFIGEPFIKYSAMEFGPVIDYQKHHLEI